MNRLWVRLSLSFALVIMTSLFMIAASVSLVNQNSFLGNIILNQIQQPGGLLDNMVMYFEDNASWIGVQSLIDEYRLPIIPTANGNAVTLMMTDEIGNVVYPFDEKSSAVALDVTIPQTSIPITVNGRVRGYFFLMPMQAPSRIDVQPFIVQQISTIIIVVTLTVSVVGVVAGTILSRSLTSPLGKLAKTAREFSKNRHIRADVHGTDEIAEVAVAFNDMADEMAKSDQMRRNLVADVAHEFRTPLTVLQANLQAILDDVYPLNKEEIVNLFDQTELLSRLVSDLHELAQADAGKIVLHRKYMNVNEFITSVTEPFQVMANQHGIVLNVQISPSELYVEADPNRLAQVVNNLLSNAMTHTPSGRSVSVTTTQKGNQAVISVKDTGAGIPTDKLEYVFERFYRVDSSRTRATGGAGLGLAIVKALVNMHEGTITVASDGVDGHGTEFLVAIPLCA